jgi:predicted porin
VTDDTRGAWGTDLTLAYRNFSIFGEYIDAFGVTNPIRYVSGGPSNRVNSARAGAAYKYGPVTFHLNYSYGRDHNPGGHQFVFDPGLNIQMTKNATLYVEYVKWDVTNQGGRTAKFDNGFELIAVWNL